MKSLSQGGKNLREEGKGLNWSSPPPPPEGGFHRGIRPGASSSQPMGGGVGGTETEQAAPRGREEALGGKGGS